MHRSHQSYERGEDNAKVPRSHGCFQNKATDKEEHQVEHEVYDVLVMEGSKQYAFPEPLFDDGGYTGASFGIVFVKRVPVRPQLKHRDEERDIRDARFGDRFFIFGCFGRGAFSFEVQRG